MGSTCSAVGPFIQAHFQNQQIHSTRTNSKASTLAAAVLVIVTYADARTVIWPQIGLSSAILTSAASAFYLFFVIMFSTNVPFLVFT